MIDEGLLQYEETRVSRRALDYAPGRVDAYLEYKELFPSQEWIGERDYILYLSRQSSGLQLRKQNLLFISLIG